MHSTPSGKLVPSCIPALKTQLLRACGRKMPLPSAPEAGQSTCIIAMQPVAWARTRRGVHCSGFDKKGAQHHAARRLRWLAARPAAAAAPSHAQVTSRLSKAHRHAARRSGSAAAWPPLAAAPLPLAAGMPAGTASSTENRSPCT